MMTIVPTCSGAASDACNVLVGEAVAKFPQATGVCS
jgi:hypothetical protein